MYNYETRPKKYLTEEESSTYVIGAEIARKLGVTVHALRKAVEKAGLQPYRVLDGRPFYVHARLRELFETPTTPTNPATT